jgi:hypothetical protein
MSECTCNNCDECYFRFMEWLKADSEGEEEEAADVPAAASPADAPVAAPAVAHAPSSTPAAHVPQSVTPAATPTPAAPLLPTSHAQSAAATAAPAGACVVSTRFERSTTGFSRCS